MSVYAEIFSVLAVAAEADTYLKCLPLRFRYVYVPRSSRSSATGPQEEMKMKMTMPLIVDD